jgi:hypothetical protein
MGTIWFLGFIGVIAARTIYAGMKADELFYREGRYSYEKKTERYLEGEKIMFYVLPTIPAAFLWFLAVPAIGLFYLGKKIGKRNVG